MMDDGQILLSIERQVMRTSSMATHEVSTSITTAYGWFYRALMSAVFAALTASVAEIGLEGVDSDFATMIRTCVIMITLRGFVHVTGNRSNPFELRAKAWRFLHVSGLATGPSWVCDVPASQAGDVSKVAPMDK
jgi:transporter family protein